MLPDTDRWRRYSRSWSSTASPRACTRSSSRCATSKGTSLPGVEIEDCGEKIGLNGVDNGLIWFREVRVPREALLNRYGDVTPEGRYESPIEDSNRRFFTMLGTLVQGRVCISAGSISAAKTALTIATRYGLRRRQFGPAGKMEVPVLDYRTQQRRLMPRLAKTFALHFAQEELTAKFDKVFSDPDVSGRERRQLESLAAGMKATATWHSIDTIQQCRESCGGAGYMAVNRFAALKADIDIFTTFEGDNTVLILLAARGLLTDYAADFGGKGPAAMVSFVAGQAVENVVDRLFPRKIGQVIADAVPTRDGSDNWLEREHQLDMFRWRQGHIVASVANRFRRGLSEGYDQFEVFRAVADHAATAARAYIDLFAARGVRDRDRPMRERSGQAGAEPRLRPVRALQHRGRQRILPGARTAQRVAVQDPHARGQPPL